MSTHQQHTCQTRHALPCTIPMLGQAVMPAKHCPRLEQHSQDWKWNSVCESGSRCHVPSVPRGKQCKTDSCRLLSQWTSADARRATAALRRDYRRGSSCRHLDTRCSPQLPSHSRSLTRLQLQGAEMVPAFQQTCGSGTRCQNEDRGTAGPGLHRLGHGAVPPPPRAAQLAKHGWLPPPGPRPQPSRRQRPQPSSGRRRHLGCVERF